jgi:hypothetical protein
VGRQLPRSQRLDALRSCSLTAWALRKGICVLLKHENSMTHATASTFDAIDLQPQASANLSFSDFVTQLLKRLEELKQERFRYYDGLRKKNARWANGARRLLAWLGAIAFLLTGLVAGLRFTPDATLAAWHLAGGDGPVLVAVLAIYALMGAIAFYERATDRTTSYFRHIGIVLAIRDLWTKLQFAVLRELIAIKSSGDPAAETAARERIRALAEAFCNDLDKATGGELSEWRTEFLASLSELEAAAKKGTEDVTKQIQEVSKAAEKAAAEAKAAAEKAADDAKAAAKAAEEAGKPGCINVTVSGEFDGEVAVLVDGAEGARSTGKLLALERVPPGIRKISARAHKGTKQLEASQLIEVKSGLQDFRIALT